MAGHSFGGGKALEAKLREIAKKAGKANTLRVGFLEGATYPDGTSVPMVAAIQEFGAPGAGIPSRPFFRNMIAARSPKWGSNLATILVNNDYDASKSLAIMGAGIGSQLVQSIKDTNAPPLSPTTLMLRKMKSEDQGLKVTGKTVGEAAARVAAGEDYSGTNTKALNDTAHMQNSISYEVGDLGQARVPGEGKS